MKNPALYGGGAVARFSARIRILPLHDLEVWNGRRRAVALRDKLCSHSERVVCIFPDDETPVDEMVPVEPSPWLKFIELLLGHWPPTALFLAETNDKLCRDFSLVMPEGTPEMCLCVDVAGLDRALSGICDYVHDCVLLCGSTAESWSYDPQASMLSTNSPKLSLTQTYAFPFRSGN